MMKSKFLNRLRAFRQAEDGTAAVELVLAVPILVWALMSTMVYFDAFHKKTLSVRAALTMADMFSREQTSIDNNYLDGAQSLLKTLSLPDGTPDMRVTVYYYVSDEKRYYSVWSEVRGTAFSPMTNADLAGLNSRLPLMSDGDRSILVETRTDYHAPFSIGIGPFLQTNLEDKVFHTFTVISPRFSSTLCIDKPPYNDIEGDLC